MDIFDTIDAPPGADTSADIFDQLGKKKQPSSPTPVQPDSQPFQPAAAPPTPAQPPTPDQQLAQLPQSVEFQKQLAEKGELMQSAPPETEPLGALGAVASIPFKAMGAVGSDVLERGRSELQNEGGMPDWQKKIYGPQFGESDESRKERLAFRYDKPLYTPQGTSLAPNGEDLQRIISQWSSPEAISMFAASEIPLGRLAMGVQMTAGAPRQLHNILSPESQLTDEQKRDEVNNLFAMGILMAKDGAFPHEAPAGAEPRGPSYLGRTIGENVSSAFGRKPVPTSPELRAERTKIAEETLNKMGKPYTLLEGEIPGHSRRVAHVLDDGSIQVSIPKLHEYLETYLKEGVKPEDAIHNAVEHEVIHNIFKEMPESEKVATDYWNDFSWIEKGLLRKIIPQSYKLSDRVLGEEAIRFFTQKAMHGTPSEFLADWRQAGIGKKMMARLLDVIGFMRRNLGRTEASARQRELLDKMRDNVSESLAMSEKGEDASGKRSAKKVAEREEGPPVGEEAPLRQQGESAPAQEPEAPVAQEAPVPLEKKAPPVAPTKGAPKRQAPKGKATKPPTVTAAGEPAAKPKIRTPSKEVKGPARTQLADHTSSLAKKGMRNATPEEMKRLRDLRKQAAAEDKDKGNILELGVGLDMERKPVIKEDDLKTMPASQMAVLRHGDGIRCGLTLSEKDLPRLEQEYKKAFDDQKAAFQEAMQQYKPGFKEGKSPEEIAAFEKQSGEKQLSAGGRANFYGGALMGASRGKHPISGANYESHLKAYPEETPSQGTPLEMEQSPWEQSADEYHQLNDRLDQLKAMGDKAPAKDLKRVYAERAKVIHQLRALDLDKAHEMDDTLSRMVREGSGFDRKSIEDMSAYVLSLKPEDREGALNAFDAWQAEEQAKKEKGLQEFQEQAASGKLRPIQELIGPDTVADLKIGARNYLRLGIKPIQVKAGKKKGEALEKQTAEQAAAEKGKAVVGDDRRVRYDVPTFDDWAAMLSERFGVKTGVHKEHLRPIWNDVVQDFLHGLSGLKLEHFRRAFKVKGSMGRLANPNTDPIIWDLQKNPSEYPKDFYKVALSLNVDLTKPGWEDSVMKYLLKKKERSDIALDKDLHPEKYPTSERKEGKITFVSGHEALGHEEMLAAIDKYNKEQADAQDRRARVINELHKVMVESGRVDMRSPLRSTITKDDINFESHAQGGPGPVAIFTPQQGKNLDLLETMLSDQAAGTAKQTQRLVMMVNDTNHDANLVSVYRTYPERKLMVYNPRGKPGDKTKNHIPLEQALRNNTVKASLLLRDPVHHFHQRWVSRGIATGELRYQQDIGFDAERQAGGGKQWKDLNALERREKIDEARRIHEERFKLTPKEEASLNRLMEKMKRDPKSVSEGDKRRLLALQRMREHLEEKGDQSGGEAKGEEAPKEDYKDMTPAEEQRAWDKIYSLGHLADISEAVDPDVIESKLSDPGFDPSDVESIPSGLQSAMYDRGLLKQVFRNTFLRDPLSAVEAEGVAQVFNDYNITTPEDIKSVLADMRKLSEDIDPNTGLPRGLEGKYFCIASALDKITLGHYLQMRDNPGRLEDYKNWCVDNGIPPGPKAQVDYHHELKLDALSFALDEIYEIAQASKRGPEKFGGALPYSVESIKKTALERYGDRARSAIEQDAAQKKSEVERPDAVKRITERIYGREATVTQRPEGEPGGEWSIELGKPIAGAGGELRGVAMPEGGKIPVGPMPEKIPGPPEPSKMLTPEESAHVVEELWKTKRNYDYVPSSEMLKHNKPLMTPAGAEGEMVRGAGMVPPESPLVPWDRPASTRERGPTRGPAWDWEGPSKGKEIKLPADWWDREHKAFEEWWDTGEGNPALEMEAEATREPMSENEWGPSRRAWQEMQQQGRRGEYPEKENQVSIQELRDEGRQIVESGELGDPETMRFNVEHGEGIDTKRAAAMIFWGQEYEAYANRIGKEKGYKSKDYADAFNMSEDWHKFLVEHVGRQSSEIMNMLRGNQDIDLGSITFVRRAAQAAVKKRGKRAGGSDELSIEEEAIGDGLAEEVDSTNNALEIAVGKQGRALTEAPIPEPQAKAVDAVIREMDRRRIAEKIAWDKKHPKSPEMAMEGPTGPAEEMSPEDFQQLVRFGGYMMFDLAKEGELSDATWRDRMLKEYPESAGHLDDLFPHSTKFRDDFISHTIGDTAATAEAKKLLSQVKSTPEYSLSVIRRAVQMDPKGKRISAPEAKHIWNIFKNKFFMADKDGIRPTFEEAIWKMSDWVKAEADKLPPENRWALPPERIMRALATNKTTKRTTKEMYEKAVANRRALTQARNWLKNLEYPGWIQKTRKIPRMFFMSKVFGHGLVGNVTHAGVVAFNPWQWKNYGQAWKDMYRMANPFGNSGELANMEYMRMLTGHERFRHWLKSGLQIDPFKYTDDYQIYGTNKFLRHFTGGRGFDALKGLRLNMAEQWWNRLPEKMRTDKYAQLISKSVNHATGIVTTPIPEPWGEYASWMMFAPKLEMSRWSWLLKDPAQAVSIYARAIGGRKVSPEEMSWANYEATQKAIMVGTYLASLAANQGLLMAARLTGHGNDQDVNFTDPTKPDWLSYKVAGFNVGIVSPMIGVVRFLMDLNRITHGDTDEQTQKQKMEGSFSRTGERLLRYGAGKLSPIGSVLGEAWMGQELYPGGRPMPWSDKQVPRYQRLQGVEKYDVPEYLLTRATPIPIEMTVQEAWKGMGMDESTARKFWRPIAVAGTAMLTGMHVSSEEE